MPFDPRQTYPLSLDCFADVPAAERPVFVYRRINGAEYLQIAKARELEGKSTAEEAESLYAALRVGLVDWKRQTNPATGEEVPFDPAKLDHVMDAVEAIELVNKRLFGARLSGGELKNCASPV